MAISKITGGTQATAGTTQLQSSINGTSVVAGDIVAVSVFCISGSPPTISWSLNPTSTCVLGSFATNIVSDNSTARLSVSYATVTTGGTIGIRANSTQTMTSGLLAYEVYRGASGVGQSTTGSGSTGTDITLSLTTQYANSWCVLFGGSKQVAQLTAGTNTTREQSVVVSNGANSISLAIGSNESALSVGTNEALHFTQGNNIPYNSAMFELVQQFTTTGSGHVTDSVANVASSLKSVSETASDAVTKVASSLKSVSESAAESATATVPTNLVAVNEAVSDSASTVASSLVRGNESATETASAQVTTNLVAANESATATSSEIASSVVRVNEQVVDSAHVVASSLVSGAGQATDVVVAVPHNPQAASGHGTASTSVVCVVGPPPSVVVTQGTGYKKPAGQQNGVVFAYRAELRLEVLDASVSGEIVPLRYARRNWLPIPANSPPIHFQLPPPIAFLPVVVSAKVDILPVVLRLECLDGTVTGEVRSSPPSMKPRIRTMFQRVPKKPVPSDPDWVILELLGMGELMGSPFAGFIGDGN